MRCERLVPVKGPRGHMTEVPVDGERVGTLCIGSVASRSEELAADQVTGPSGRKCRAEQDVRATGLRYSRKPLIQAAARSLGLETLRSRRLYAHHAAA